LAVESIKLRHEAVAPHLQQDIYIRSVSSSCIFVKCDIAQVTVIPEFDELSTSWSMRLWPESRNMLSPLH